MSLSDAVSFPDTLYLTSLYFQHSTNEMTKFILDEAKRSGLSVSRIQKLRDLTEHMRKDFELVQRIKDVYSHTLNHNASILVRILSGEIDFVGSVVSRLFEDGTVYFGKVFRFEPHNMLWRVRYYDTTKEDFELWQLQQCSLSFYL